MEVFALNSNIQCPSSDMNCGIYFLFLNKEIVYIGQSENIYSRVGAHFASEKVFDEWNFILAPRDELSDREAALIVKHKPIYNQALPSNSIYASANTIKKDYGVDRNRIKSLCKQKIINSPAVFNGIAYYKISDFEILAIDGGLNK